jgi:hypothetical protein
MYQFISVNIPSLPNQQLQDDLTAGSAGQRNAINEIYTLQTGQTTSYATGDDGYYQFGRLVDFFTLKTNNVFGNTYRFTDENGNFYLDPILGTKNIATAFQTGYVIDHSTGLGWAMANFSAGPVTWPNALTAIAGITLLGHSDFFMPNINEYPTLLNTELTTPIGYYPFLAVTAQIGICWTSTTWKNNTGNAYKINMNATLPITGSLGKSGTMGYFAARLHF